MNAPAACPNCGATLADQPRPPKFCPACGQETLVRAPRLGEFLQQFGGAYLSTEGALWRTLKLLLTKPGELTRQYLAGRRKHYVLPLRLYLTISVVLLLALRLAASDSMQVQVRPGKDSTASDTFSMEMFGGRAGRKDGTFFCHDLPAWMCKRLETRIDFSPAARQQTLENLRERFMGNLGGAMFVLLPGFALWMKLVYWNRRLRYTEHLVFALHLHAFWFIALGLTLLHQPWLGGVALVAMPVYTALAMRRVYGGRWVPLLLRGAVAGLLYIVTLSLALVGVGLVALLV